MVRGKKCTWVFLILLPCPVAGLHTIALSSGELGNGQPGRSKIFDLHSDIVTERSVGPARHLGGYSAVSKLGALLQQGYKQIQHAVPLLGSLHRSILCLVSYFKALTAYSYT